MSETVKQPAESLTADLDTITNAAEYTAWYAIDQAVEALGLAQAVADGFSDDPERRFGMLIALADSYRDLAAIVATSPILSAAVRQGRGTGSPATPPARVDVPPGITQLISSIAAKFTGVEYHLQDPNAPAIAQAAADAGIVASPLATIPPRTIRGFHVPAPATGTASR